MAMAVDPNAVHRITQAFCLGIGALSFDYPPFCSDMGL